MGGVIDALGPQMPMFLVGHRPHVKIISITPLDAAAIIDILKAQASPDALAAAGKIARATRLHETTHVELGIGEDEETLTALDELRRGRGTLGRKLTRLETALRAKIDAEG